MSFIKFLRDIFKKLYKWIFKSKENTPIVPEIKIPHSVVSISETPRENDSARDLPVEYKGYSSIENTPREEEAYRTLPQMEREPTAIEQVLDKLTML